MNDKQQFYNEFYSALEKAMEPSGGHLQKVDVPKNNSVKKGITIKFDNVNIAPTVYPDIYYPDWKSGHSMSDIVTGVRTELMRTAPTMGQFTVNSLSRENAPNHLYAAVVNYENNKDWLKKIPHERIADLAVFAKWRFDPDNSYEVMAGKVTEPLLARLQLTKEEALKIAKTNTGRDASLEPISHAIMALAREDGTPEEIIQAILKEADDPFYVLSNKTGIDGAALIADSHVLKQVHETLEENFYILPSSIHEVLIVPESKALTAEELKKLVFSVNREEVPVEDRLSDEVYKFDGHSLKLAGMDGLTEEHNITDTIKHHRSR